MTTDEFWALIEATRPAEPDPDLHAHALSRRLEQAGVEATVEFSRHFDAAMDALYRWDVWGAVYLLRGGCSNDSFDYARAWVVGEGRTTWEQVRTDPEGWAVELVDGVVAEELELFESLDDRGFDDGESLLYAANTSHERATGAWIPANPDRVVEGPAGEEWDEDEVEEAFPRLAAALVRAEAEGAIAPSVSSSHRGRSGWDDEGSGEPLRVFRAGATGAWPGATAFSDPVDALEVAARLQSVMQAVADAEERYSRGDHAGVVAALTPALDDPEVGPWLVASLPQDMAAELLYHGGISRLQCGDPDGAANWLRIGVATGADDDRVRRALAQVEIGRGELDQAEALLDTGPAAAPMDLALAAAVAGYRCDHAEVVRRCDALLAVTEHGSVDLHPWDRAGTYVLAGLALLEVGEGQRVAAAAERVRALVEGAPPELPLVAQGSILAAGAHRLAGDLVAAEASLVEALALVRPATSDLGLVELEAARIHRAAGREAEATEGYRRAVATFTAAGERFLVERTEAEAASML